MRSLLLSLVLATQAQAFENCSALDGSERVQQLVPGKDGWIFRQGADLVWDGWLAPSTIGVLTRLKVALEARGTALMVLRLPPRGLAQFGQVAGGAFAPILTQEEGTELYGATLDGLREAGIITPDLLRDAPDPYYFARDHHWRPATAAWVAERVSDAWAKAGGEFGTNAFVTRAAGSGEHRSSLGELAARVCGVPPEPEMTTRYETEQEASEDAALDLFGGPELRVALVGTSFSDADAYNFEGFLSEELGTPVENYAISGGGLETSIASYLASDQFVENAPALLIWEIPGWHNLNAATVAIEQTLPLIERCSGPQQQVTMAEGRAIWSEPGAGHAIRIEADGVLPVRLGLTLRYSDGATDRLRLDWTDRHRPAPRRAAMLPRPLAPLQAIEIEGEGDAMRLSLCTDHNPS